MSRLRDALIAEYTRGLVVSRGQASRLMGVAILDHVLASGVLSSEPRRIAADARAALNEGPLSDHDADSYGDSLLTFLMTKNGSAVVVVDAEDRAVRACFEALISSVPDEDLYTVACQVEDLFLGRVGEIRLSSDP